MPVLAYVDLFPPDLLMEYRIFISIVDISANLKNIDININIDKEILENINIDIDIDKKILKNIDGNPWGEQEEGEEQGDPKAGGDFNVAIQKDVVELDRALDSEGGMARFGQDDGYAVGPPEELFPAVARFSRSVEERCGLMLVPSKSEVYCRDGRLPPACLPGISLAGMEVDGTWENGLICYGVPIGSDNFVKAKLNLKVAEVKKGTARAIQVLSGEKQAL